MNESATAGLISDVENSSAQSMANMYQNQGLSASRGLLGQDQSQGMNHNLAYGNQAMTSAIKNRYRGQQSVGEQHLMNTLNQAGQDAYLKKLEVTANAANQEHQINLQKEILKQKQSLARRAQRGQIVGQVLGITGAVVGGVAGAMAGGVGAPAGAMAGYAAGTAAGNAIGSA